MNDLITLENDNSFSSQLAQRELIRDSGTVSIEKSRAVREVEAALTVAALNKRDECDAWARVKSACNRLPFAEKAMYRYKRGGENVEGPSIRLAEAMARAFGNLDYGWRELERGGNRSVLEAFCWDLETNTKKKMTFEVAHIRDTKQGPKPLTTERDIYEHLANYASRRVRNCILSIIPADINESAQEECKATLIRGISSNRQDIAKKLVSAFDEIGVSHDQVRKFLGVEKVVGATDTQLAELRQIYTTIREGHGSVREFFNEEYQPIAVSMLQNKKEALTKIVAEIEPDILPKLGDIKGKIERSTSVAEIDKLDAVIQELVSEYKKARKE